MMTSPTHKVTVSDTGRTPGFFRIPQSRVPHIIAMFTIIALIGMGACALLQQWSMQFNDVYPDFVRQKAFLYLRNFFLAVFLIGIVLECILISSSAMRRTVARIMPNIILVLVALLFALIVAELIARVVYEQRFVVFELHGIHRKSPVADIIYELRPDAEKHFYYKDQDEKIHYKINSSGLRGEPVAREKAPGVFRIITIGDSVSFGVRVDQDEIYSARLQEYLNQWAREKDMDGRFEVLNPSACGWNTFNEVSWLEHHGRALDPDLVLVQFSMNDVDDPLVHMGTTILYHLNDIPDAFFPH